MEVAQKDDMKFSSNLLNVYQLANYQEKAIKLQEIIQTIKTYKFEPIDWFVYHKK